MLHGYFTYFSQDHYSFTSLQKLLHNLESYFVPSELIDGFANGELLHGGGGGFPETSTSAKLRTPDPGSLIITSLPMIPGAGISITIL